MKKFNVTKKLSALLLAAIMILSAVPLAFATPAEPVEKLPGNIKDGVYGGHYVHFIADLQSFTFIQDADNQEFQFTLNLGAKKNQSINYGWIYAGWEREQTVTSPIGKNHTVTWSSYHEGLETIWKYSDITVKFTGDGGKTYNTELKVIYDAGSSSFNDRWEADYKVPLTVKVIDKRALNEALSNAETKGTDQGIYSDETWNVFTECKAIAGSYTGNVIAKQSVIDEATANLNAAINNLKAKPADYTAFNRAKARAKAVLEDKNSAALYTEATLKALEEKYNEALLLEGLDLTYQAQVNAKAAELENAVSALELLPCNYDRLNDALAEGNALLGSAEKANYTEESVRALENAVSEASAVLKNQNITYQKVVDAAEKKVRDAYAGLTFRPADYSKLDAAIEKAESFISDPENEKLYTPGEMGKLKKAVQEAKQLDRNLTIKDQAAVDEAVKALENVKPALKTADYSELDRKISAAEALLEDNAYERFTAESVDKMKEALKEAKNIDRNADITKQNIIDTAASKLADAIKKLVPAEKLSQVKITHNGKAVKGHIAFEKVKWYKKYKSHSTVLGFEADGKTASVKWEPDRWSVEKPEATITENKDGTVTVTPNGRGIGARSVWLKLTVTDNAGNTAADYVKVRFYKWSWQTGNLF